MFIVRNLVISIFILICFIINVVLGSKWAIVALTRSGRKDLPRRNELIFNMIQKYGNNRDITIIMFSEEQITNNEIQKWQNQFGKLATVKYIDTSSNGFLNTNEKFGYKYMCKFFMLDIYEYLKPYDYYLRCDTDCYITKLDYDIFDWVEKNKVEYAYGIRKLEAHGPTKNTLPKWVDSYMSEHSITPKSLMNYPLSTCFNFYNNFHIAYVPFFNRKDVKDFLLAVNSSGNVLAHRWGDSTIQAYAVRLFMNTEKIKQVPNFEYIHGSHGNRIVNTFGNGELTNVPQILPPWNGS